MLSIQKKRITQGQSQCVASKWKSTTTGNETGYS